MVSVSSGDVVFVDYTGRVAADKSVFATTSKEDAQKAGLSEEGQQFKPVLVVAGKGQVVKGLDDAIVGSEVGKRKHVSLSADKAFGVRDPEKMRLIPIAEFRKQDVHPYAGMPVRFEGGVSGFVKSVEGGRVRVDFNAPLAGEAVEYDFTVVKCASAPKEKLEALLDGIVGLNTLSYDSASGTARVVVAASVRKDSDFVVNKVTFVSMALQYVDGLKKVVFEEEYAAGKE